MQDLHSIIHHFQKTNQIVEVSASVDPNLEIAEIHRRVAAADGPALLFTNVKNSSFPVVTNLFGSRSRVDDALGPALDSFLPKAVKLMTGESLPSFKDIWKERSLLFQLLKSGTKKVNRAPVQEMVMEQVDLKKLPFLKCWPQDGGSFLTLPLVYTESLEGKPPNLGMYRMQRFNSSEMGMHWQIEKGGGYHYHLAEQLNQNLPVNVFLGGPPALIISAILPLPENVPELLFASFLLGSKISMTKSKNMPLIANAEFAFQGYVAPHERRPEGPFGDHYGYYSLQHPFPVFKCQKLYHRRNAVYPATVVGKPRQEDYYIGEYLQDWLKPVLSLAMPGVIELWSYAETGFHALSAARVKERYGREAMKTAFRILGEGQLSLTKFLLLTNHAVDLSDFKQTLMAVLERFNPKRDIYILPNLSIDTLDYTGTSLNKGSKGVIIGVGPVVRKLPSQVQTKLEGIDNFRVFCPGCLVVSSSSMTPDQIVQLPGLKEWPMIVQVDDVEEATSSSIAFLWAVFMRFEPASDMYFGQVTAQRTFLSYDIPLLIDARTKKQYPDVVECDPITKQLVDNRWGEYFPHQHVEMGDSSIAHVK